VWHRLHRLRKNSKLCHSERSEESFFVVLLYLNPREILRFAQNDRKRHFFRSLFRLSDFLKARLSLADGNPAGLSLRHTNLRSCRR
jgi:hypothetical protein